MYDTCLTYLTRMIRTYFSRSCPVALFDRTRPAPGAKACYPMGMFGSPFGNYSPVNGIVLPGPAVKAIVPKQVGPAEAHA